MSDQQPDTATSPSRSFGPIAEMYDRVRPDYPLAAAEWLTGSECAVLDLGAGTGKLTARLVELRHDVYATDPDDDMLAILRSRLPDVHTAVAPAEAIPLPDDCMDVVVCAQSFHWFDQSEALPEIARVLVPGGRLALVWNEEDVSIPWVRRLQSLIKGPPGDPDTIPIMESSDLFGEVEEKRFSHWRQVDKETLLDLVASKSHIATLTEDARNEKLAQVGEFYDEFERGIDGLRLPYVTHCFRTTAVIPEPPAEEDEAPLIDFN